jgi:hypothetical protein
VGTDDSEECQVLEGGQEAGGEGIGVSMIKFCDEARETIPGFSAFDAIEALYGEGL